MFKIIIAEFKHETNTYSDQRTDLHSFKNCEYVLENEIIPFYTNVQCEIGGFLKILDGQPDVELIPVVSASAVPSGLVTKEMFELMCDKMVNAIHSAGKIDGVLLSLHGALVTEICEDGDGEFLEAIRKATGKQTVIISTLDLHSNITEKMVDNADALFNFDTYPHIDAYERGLEAAETMLKTLRGELKPVMRYTKLPFIMACMPTERSEMSKFVRIMSEYEKNPRIISVSISHGFHCADIHDLGLSVIAVTDDDAATAQKVSDELSSLIWEDRANLTRKLYTAQEAIDIVNNATEGPIVLSDGSDNPGGGSTCDGTHLLRAMIDRKVQNAAVAMIYDPESVKLAEKAGVGNVVSLSLGGKLCPHILGRPIECNAYVKLICDGKYKIKGPVGRGLPVDLIKSAVVVIDDIEVIIASNLTQPYDAEIFRIHGIEPKDKKVLMVKSAVHFRADFEQFARQVIDVECPGLIPLNPVNIKYEKCRRPIYPLDNI